MTLPAGSTSRILQAAFRRKQTSHPGYSRRAFARDLGVSPAFVTRVLSGEKALPRERIRSVARLLELDIHERASLAESVILGCPETRELMRMTGPSKPRLPARGAIGAGSAARSVLSRWWILAVLEGLSLSEEERVPERIRTRLGLTSEQWSEAVRCLTQAGLVREERGELSRVEDHLYVPSGRSRREIREFHGQMIGKAREELLTRTADEDFHRRLITGFTFPADPRRIEALKARILTFLDELSREAGAEESRDVYQCNVQLFPLTRRT